MSPFRPTPAPSPFFSAKRTALALAAAIALAGLGVATRMAEDNQVGDPNTVSTWVFFCAGLCAYLFCIGLFLCVRRRLKSPR